MLFTYILLQESNTFLVHQIYTLECIKIIS